MMNQERKLNILHVIVSAGPTNSQYNFHCLPMRHQRNVSMCTYFQETEIPPSEITLFNGDNSLLGFFRVLKAALQAQDYDIITVHSPITGFLFVLATLVWGLHRKIQPHSVYVVHNSYPNFKIRNQLLMIPVFAWFKQLIFCSNSSIESFPHHLRQIGGKKINVVQNAADLDRIDGVISRIDREQKNDYMSIISVGRLIPIKNPFTLLKAFEQSQDGKSQLIFIGDGDLRPLMTQEIEQMGLQKLIKMTGLVSREEVFKYSAQSDLFISTSRGEGLPVAVLEVMASGCPVILSDIPPHREIAEQVDFIPLISPDDVEGFTREIRRFQDMSDEQRREIGHKCRRLVEEQFSMTSLHKGYQQVYDLVLAEIS